MGRLTIDPIALLFTSGLVLLCSCSPSGAGGSGYTPPVPLQLADLASHLTVSDQTVSELFTSDDPLEFVLAADFDQLKKDRSQESEDRPGQILIKGRDGEPVEIPMHVKTRGNFRLRRRICPDPPLRLNLPETNPLGTVFDGQDKLKLVTHCRDSDRYEQNLLEEYLAYRLFNQFTDIGFRVQLAKVTYLDTSGKNDPVSRTAFLIEDEEAMAARLGGTMIEAPTSNPDDFVLDELGLVYLFQFMVGNVDWGIGSSHNIKILLKDHGYYPIPYDFDWTGLVYAPYAGPNTLTQHLHKTVRERVYWGACVSSMDYQAIFDRFNGERGALLDLVRNQPGLSESNVDSAVEYLEEFYEVINDPREARGVIISACRK